MKMRNYRQKLDTNAKKSSQKKYTLNWSKLRTIITNNEASRTKIWNVIIKNQIKKIILKHKNQN